jgi:large subunit ribosomal protein L1
MAKISKRVRNMQAQVDTSTLYPPREALELIKKLASTKFDETVEFQARLGINPKYADQQVRTTVVMPRGIGKTKRIAVITQGERIKIAEQAGADLVGSDELIEKIQGGFLEFDILIATPDIMPKVARLGKLLGPKGLMPNPKAGTVTTNLLEAINEFKAGKLEFRADRTGIVHVPVGKVSFSVDFLMDNAKALQETIDRAKPAGAKGRFWRTVHVKSSMGPAIEIDINVLRDMKAT